MSDGERYVVELDLKRGGDFGLDQLDGRLRRSERNADKLKAAWKDLGAGVAPFSSAIDAVASKTLGMARTMGVAGGVAMFAGATYGVANLNNELEKAEISLGTILSANGMASSVPIGIERAKALIGDMRKDAQKLPGEFDDLMRIFTTGAIPAFHSGANIEQFRELSSKAMAAGKVASMDLHQVAREFAMLMEGRSGAHNVFGMKLLGLSGDKASQFNSMAADKRMALISKELDKYTGAIDAFSGSFDAQSSTLIDNLKGIGRTATSSLFIHVKDAMRDANTWFEKHQGEALMFAARWGSRMANAFESGKRFLLEWGPIVAEFGSTAYDRVTAAWIDVQPYVQKFGDVVKRALEDPNGTIDKLIELAKLWAVMRVGGSFAGGLATGGLKGALSTGGAGLAAYGVTDAAVNGGSFGSGAATTLGGAAMGGSVGGPWGAVGGAFVGSLVSMYQGMADASAQEAQIRANMESDAESSAVRMRRTYQAIGLSASEYEAAMMKSAHEIQQRTSEVDDAMGLMAGAIYAGAANIEAASYGIAAAHDRRNDEIGSYWGNMLRLSTSTQKAQAEREREAGGKNSAAGHKAKGGGSGVMKVEIVVTSNQHPNRIAREVVGELGRRTRMSGSSPHVTNFSALGRG